jgi:hypothetical protein
MKNLVNLFILTFFAASLTSLNGCKKDSEIPTLTTSAVSGITKTTAIAGGMVTSDGGAEVKVRGVCWSAFMYPTIDDNVTTDGAGLGSFISNLDNLLPGTLYFVRAYAVSSAGVAYGIQQNFTTESDNTDNTDDQGGGTWDY